MIKTTLVISNENLIVILSIMVVLFIIIVVCKIVEGSLHEMDDSPDITKKKYVIRSVTENKRKGTFLVTTEKLGEKIIIPIGCEIVYIQEGEMYLEIIQVVHYYVQKRLFRQDKKWVGIPRVKYKLVIKRENISVRDN